MEDGLLLYDQERCLRNETELFAGDTYPYPDVAYSLFGLPRRSLALFDEVGEIPFLKPQV